MPGHAAMPRSILLILLLFPFPATHAQLFVTEALEVGIHASPNRNSELLTRVRGGSPLTLVEVDQPSGFSRVRSEDGVDGWIQSFYLTDTPSREVRLEELTQQIEILKEERAVLESNLAGQEQICAAAQAANEEQYRKQRSDWERERGELVQLRDRLADSERMLDEARQERGGLNEELRRLRLASDDPEAMADENRRLEEELSRLRSRVGEQRERVKALEAAQEQRWFIVGGGVFGAGVLSATILSLLFRNARRKES